ncbi:hypothetical protein BM221_004451 [Beauveria bassiana]|uniref:Uncharacterized protein n=1 Tax=Beauveria bassiana TaxID=176275 RepID=A0A2N6NRB9_BEABA|nr:hypothetical protein BM221_010852 [Beauveria bassiana]PMB69804.1 hypothetical protein BM221_004451 [Beauveria bassiana]
MPWHVTEVAQGTLEITIGKNNTTSKRPTSTAATKAGTSSTVVCGSHSPKDEPTPHPGWDGPAPNPGWDGPASNQDWDGPASSDEPS